MRHKRTRSTDRVMKPDSIRPDNPTDPVHRAPDSTALPATALARWVSLGSLGLLACLWLAIVLSTWSVREAAIGRATSSVNNLSAAFCLQIDQTLNTVAAAMDITARAFRADPMHFSLERFADELPLLARPTMYASLTDAKGDMISTTIRPAPVGLNFSDREHFKVHVANPRQGLFISVPLMGRTGNKPMVLVTKRVDDAAGQMLGVLGFALAPDDLTELHRSINLGPQGVIALVGLDGRARARFGYQPNETASNAPWPVMLAKDTTEGVVRTNALDGISRIYSLRQLPHYPMIVVAGLALDDELTESRTHLALEVGIGIAASLLLGALTVLLVREIGRRNQRELELAREHIALEAARAALLAEQGKLAAVNGELLVSTERAEAANLAKSQFLAQMSHELRTPLHAVIGFSELIAHHVMPLPSGDQIAGYANDIMKSGRHLLELINSILDLSKVESGSAHLVETVVPLVEVIQDSMMTVREQAMESGVDAGPHYTEELPRIYGDTTKLRQIFINLLSNAVKFTPRGGSVTVSARRRDDGGLSVIVSDTGIGMNQEEMAVAMEPFGQVENSLARSFAGTGLGLPLARQMTELHGGRLTLRSVKGTGTTVEIYLPGHRVIWSSTVGGDQGAAVGLER